MKLGIIISSANPENIWNALRLANLTQKKGDFVEIFLVSQGVEAPILNTEKFNITKLMQEFVDGGGKIHSCVTCLKLRGMEAKDICPVANMDDLYTLIKTSEKVITF